MASRFDEQCEALLMFLEEAIDGDRDVERFLTGLGLARQERFDVVASLAARELVVNDRKLARVDCRLTGEGRHRAQQLIEQRPARRAAELRTRMLRWLDTESRRVDWSGFLASDQVVYQQHPFTKTEVEHQAEFLFTVGLITALSGDQAVDGIYGPKLSPRGRDCLIHGGDVAAYLGTSPVPSSTTVRNSQDTYIGSITGGMQSWNSATVSQVQHNNAPAGYEELSRIVELLLAQLPGRTELIGEAREDIQEAAEETLAVIAGPEPKLGKVRRLIDSLVGALGRAALPLGQGMAQGVHEGTAKWAGEHSQLLLNSLPM
ncbi:hypothetical protein ACFWIW_28195 [Amycolatopsis sp. NPDC058340]|uniref:hypothetical protein n=1 Tax=Amycolatopsis sp. NPDC058340 TaxID=3346453 RepID=UPI0036652998